MDLNPEQRRALVSSEMMDREMIEIIRAKNPAERLAIAFGMWRSARRMIESILRTQHPEWTGEAIDREIARRMSHGAV